MKRKTKEFDKYWHYHASVQAPDVDARFLFDLYRRLRGKKPKVLREDFCGTFAILCEWVKLNPKNRGIGIDLDPEPLQYGAEHYLPFLSEDQQARLKLMQDDVLRVRPGLADVAVAMNFSYFIFHERKLLLEYFRKVYLGLKANGFFVTDVFGGPACLSPVTDRSRKRGFVYYWEQENFEPVTHRARFHIHFKRKNEKIRRRVFSYDWRLWTLPEISEVMREAGFQKTLVYWEDDKGNFRPTVKGDSDCGAWIAYVVGLK